MIEEMPVRKCENQNERGGDRKKKGQREQGSRREE